MLQTLEKQLDDTVSKLPFQLPENARKGLAGAMWWLALIFGLLQLWVAWAFWHLGHVVNQLADWANSVSYVYGTGQHVERLGVFFYATLVVVLIDAVLLLLAVPGLKAMNKKGWNLLYYSLIVETIYGVVRIFSNIGGGIGNFFSALISALVGVYFLFEVRKYFLGLSAVRKDKSSVTTK